MKDTKIHVRLISLILALLFITSAGAVLRQNAVCTDTEPKYSIIDSAKAYLSISSLTATCSSDLKTTVSASLSITMELQKLSSGTYSTVKTWSSSRTGTSLSMDESKLINVFSTYRLKVTFTAGSESVTRYAY